MSFTSGIILFWLLPALITWLLVLLNWRINYRRPEQLSHDSWIELFFFGAFYPIVWIAVTLDFIKPFLVKERKLWD